MKKINSVYLISLVCVTILAVLGIAVPEAFGNAANIAFAFLTGNFGWFYLLAMFFFVAFMMFIAFSKFGKIRLGADDSKPEYSYISWFAMLFSAGMGIGLIFWGIAEPLNHYMAPFGVASASPEAGEFAIYTSFFHWGIHPWANYAIVALPLAYMQFRKNKPGLISSIFIPILGENASETKLGKLIDILAILATVAGVATSLGLGVLQINGGLNYMFGIPISTTVHIIIIVIVTLMFMASAISGLDKGIKFLSNANIALAGTVMILTLIAGPTILILNSFTTGTGTYLGNIITESLKLNPFGDNSWFGAWRIFYWAWWIAWAPVVGVFIARISKGRTIREFVIGVTLVPALGSFLWFAIFGTTGINLGPEVAAEAIKTTETAFFVVMKHIPFGQIISVITVILLCTFFVTSADSATFVLGMLSSRGDLNPDNQKKIAWGCIQSLMAFALMLAGGLKVLQIASIVAAFPFAIVMLFACAALFKALKAERF